ncbi:hypothetical protein ABW20_dc0106272 [Dactylellina cionopaga]|nr:hypothetical protein ABW20_dc0106272 [Dactylellina cionopaga]
MHGDHMFGIVPLLCTLLNGAGGSVGVEDPRKAAAEGIILDQESNRKADFEIYGPEGLREYIRTSLRLTRSMLAGTYVVHELHSSKEGSVPSASQFKDNDSTENRMPMEFPGYNIFPGVNGLWEDILGTTESSNIEWTVSAGPILHSVPCVGYVLTEPPLLGKITPDYKDKILANKEELIKSGIKNPMSLLSKVSALADGEIIELPNGDKLSRPPDRRGRKITILGDTCDSSGITSLAEGSDVLIHEATNAFLGGIADKNSRDYKEGETYEDVKKKTIEHGHSTPEMAADFALSIGLGQGGGIIGRLMGDDKEKKAKGKKIEQPKGLLLLNHFSSRYADPRSSGAAADIMEGIRNCAAKVANESLAIKQDDGQAIDIVCAYDLMQYEIRASD